MYSNHGQVRPKDTSSSVERVTVHFEYHHHVNTTIMAKQSAVCNERGNLS